MARTAHPAFGRGVTRAEGSLVAAAAISMLLHVAVVAWLLLPTAEPPGLPDSIAVDLILEEPATAAEPTAGAPAPDAEPPPAMPEPEPPAPVPEPAAPESAAPEPPVAKPPIPEPEAVAPPAPPPLPAPPPTRKPRAPSAAAPPKPTAPTTTTAGAPTAGAPAARVPAAPAQSQPSAAPSPSASLAVPADYAAMVNGRLEQAKTYPRLARMRQEQGTAQVHFALAGDGRVTACTVTGSSGHKLLDEEACALVFRASPLPPPPGAAPNSRVELSAPIRFSIR